MTTSLVFEQGTAQTSVGAVLLDALVGETTELNSKATEYVVEDGPPVTDHIVQDPEILQLTGWVTGADLMMFGAEGRSRLVSVKEALRTIHAERVPVTVTTGMDVYTNMAMESCKIERSNKGDFFDVQCSFKKIRKAALRTVDIPPDKAAGGKGGKTKVNVGKQTPTEASPREASTAKRVKNSAVGT